MDRIYNYYENYCEDTRLVKDNSHRIEFITTTHIIDKTIKSCSRILDVGAGTGRYSIYLAEKGHSVYAIEYVSHNLDIIQEKIKCLEFGNNIQASIGDGRDLSRFEDERFDVVLCMGPIYHLNTIEDRKQCVGECIRVLKKDGILALAYINKFASFLYQFKADKEFIKNEASKNLINFGQFTLDGSDTFYFTSPKEVESMLQGYKVEIVTNVGTDGIAYLFKETVDNFDETEYQNWIEHHLRTCSEPSILGYSLHGLLIARKL